MAFSKASETLKINYENAYILENIPPKIKLIIANTLWCALYLEKYCKFILKNYNIHCFFPVIGLDDCFHHYDENSIEINLLYDHCQINIHNIGLKKNRLLNFI